MLRTGIQDLCFPQNGNIGYAIDADRVLKTTNKGQTWTTLIEAPGNYFDHIEPIDANNLLVINNSHNIYKVLKISNGGSRWTFLKLPSNSGTVGYAHFITSDKGWVQMNHALGGRLYYTANGGLSWKMMNDPETTPFNCKKIKFINDSTGYSIYEQYQTLKTTDAGKTWEEIDRETTFHCLGYTHEAMFTIGKQIWVGGDYGLLEMNAEESEPVIPGAYFKIDTTDYDKAASIKLVNYLREHHQFEW